MNRGGETLSRTDELLYGCHLKEAIRMAMDLAHETNRYLDEKAPWKTIKEDRQATADSLYTAIAVISTLRTMLYPFLPFSSQKLHEMLGFDGKVEDCGWEWRQLPPGQKLQPPQPLFTKLDDKVVDEEYSRLRAAD
jgi:methionyl-tRNA synthetase